LVQAGAQEGAQVGPQGIGGGGIAGSWTTVGGN